MAKAISKPLALAVAVGLTLGGSFGAGAPAFAQEGTTPVEGVNKVLPGASLIEEGNVYSLTLHKRTNPPVGDRLDTTGEPIDNPGGQPLPGAKFEITRVEGDVRTQSGLNSMVNLINDYNNQMTNDVQTRQGTMREGTTGENGLLKFDNLEAGVYLVRETQAPAGTDGQTYVPGRPFLVLVPMTNAEGTAWNSEVHAYPKNAEVRIDKQVQDANKHAKDEQRDDESSEVTYTLNGVVPQAPEGKTLQEFVIRDSYNDAELEFAEGFTPVVERIPAGNGQPEAISANLYTLNRDAALPNNRENIAEGANKAFSITFDEAGLNAAGLTGGDTVRVTVKATMLKAADQQIENSVNESGIFRDPFSSHEFETPNDKVTSYIGNIRVIKEDENNNNIKLAGAEFELFRCDDHQEILNGAHEKVIERRTTDENGEITFEGIHVSDWVNDAAPDAVTEYCLDEVVAPEGYMITREEPYRIKLNRESKAFVGEGPNDRQTIRLASLTVTNLPESERPVLPSTGGMGILIVALLGLGIIAGGVYAARRNSAKA